MSSLFKLHKEKDRVKVSCDFAIKRIIGLVEGNGKGIVASWQRGSRISSGHTKLALCTNGEVAWDDKFVVQYNLYKSANTDKFDEKALGITITADKKTLYKVTFDLSTHAKSSEDKIIDVPLTKKLNGPILQMTMQTKWLKINDKLLVSQEDHPVEENKRQSLGRPVRAVMEMDGTNYALKTDDALTDNSSVDPTSSWDEDEVPETDDVFAATSMYEAERKKSQDDYEVIKKQLRMVEGESLQREKTIEIQSLELAQLRQRLAQIEASQTDSEELVQRAYGVESFMQQRLAVAEQEHVEQIAAIKKGHDNVVAGLKDEIEKLKENSAVPSYRDTERAAEESKVWKAKLAEAERTIKDKDAEMHALMKAAEKAQTQILELQSTALLTQHSQKTSVAPIAATTTPSKSSSSASSVTQIGRRSIKPDAHFFTNPLLDKYWPLLLLVVVYFILSFDTLFA